MAATTCIPMHDNYRAHLNVITQQSMFNLTLAKYIKYIHDITNLLKWRCFARQALLGYILFIFKHWHLYVFID